MTCPFDNQKLTAESETLARHHRTWQETGLDSTIVGLPIPGLGWAMFTRVWRQRERNNLGDEMEPNKTFEEWMEIPEFAEWYAQRPPAVQDMIRKIPPGCYRIQGGPFPGTTYSYDEEEDGTVTIRVYIDCPFFPRRVFGLRPEHFEPWTEEMEERISWYTDRIEVDPARN